MADARESGYEFNLNLENSTLGEVIDRVNDENNLRDSVMDVIKKRTCLKKNRGEKYITQDLLSTSVTVNDVSSCLSDLVREGLIIEKDYKGATMFKLNDDRYNVKEDMTECEEQVEENLFEANVLQKLELLARSMDTLIINHNNDTANIKRIACLEATVDGKDAIISLLKEGINFMKVEISEMKDKLNHQNNCCQKNADHSLINDSLLRQPESSTCFDDILSNSGKNSSINSLTSNLDSNTKPPQQKLTLIEQLYKIRAFKSVEYKIFKINVVNDSNTTLTKHINRVIQDNKSVDSNSSNLIDDNINNSLIDINHNHILDDYVWNDTTLIAGDSMLYGIDEKRISKDNKVKVRFFPGAKVADMHYYLQPLLKKQPKVLILHVGTNDTGSKTSKDILKSLTDLKDVIRVQLPSTKVIFSTPIKRFDNPKSQLCVDHLSTNLRESGHEIVDNINIQSDGIGKKGLHLNNKGIGKFAINLIKKVRSI